LPITALFRGAVIREAGGEEHLPPPVSAPDVRAREGSTDTPKAMTVRTIHRRACKFFFGNKDVNMLYIGHALRRKFILSLNCRIRRANISKKFPVRGSMRCHRDLSRISMVTLARESGAKWCITDFARF
jgi:hypothetical protein